MLTPIFFYMDIQKNASLIDSLLKSNILEEKISLVPTIVYFEHGKEKEKLASYFVDFPEKAKKRLEDFIIKQF